MQKKYFLGALLCLIGGRAMGQDHLVFNEVMQSNIDYLMVDRDFPDSWVEIYNPTDKAVSLDGMRIGEHADGKNAYSFGRSAGVVPAGGHVVVYCDKEGTGLHTSFRIDSGKASIYLFDQQGIAIDSLSLAKMPAPNIAYGRVTDGALQWQYELKPTAGGKNEGGGSNVVLPEPSFSVGGGVFTEAFNLTVTIPVAEGLPEDTKLYYTLDGSEPTAMSDCTAEALTLNVSRTTVVRAKLISAFALSPVSSVQSFIFHPRQTQLPVISIVTDPAYIFGSDLGIASAKVNDGIPNYMRKWRRPINIEYYDMRNGGQMVFNQLGETAVSGVSTREQPQKSFKVYANKRFGKKTYKGDFWTDKPEVDKVKSFVLRSGGNNSFTTRINDALVQKLFGTHVDNLDWQAYQPVVVYINGVYKGEFGMRERSNEDFVEANYDLEDVEVADETSYQSPEQGSHFASFRDAYRSASTSYKDLEAQMDMDNFTKALIAEMYAMNTDFPTNNVSMWRTLEGTEETSAGNLANGKWRWILKDLDRAGMNIALYPYSFDMFNYLFNPDDLQFSGMYHFDLYKKMSQLPEFKRDFADKMMVCLGDFLKPELVNALVDTMSNEIYDELKYTFQAYNCTSEWKSYKQNVKNLKQFFAERPNYLYTQTARYFQLGEVIPLSVANPDTMVVLNGMHLTESDFSGSCFETCPITLDSGDRLKGWKLTVMTPSGEVVEHTFESKIISLLPADYAASSKEMLSLETYDMEDVTDTPGEDVIPGEDNPGEDNPGEIENPDDDDTPTEGGNAEDDTPGIGDDSEDDTPSTGDDTEDDKPGEGDGSEDDTPSTGDDAEDNNPTEDNEPVDDTPADAVTSPTHSVRLQIFNSVGLRQPKLRKGLNLVRKGTKVTKIWVR